jgi:hypothetical protein
MAITRAEIEAGRQILTERARAVARAYEDERNADARTPACREAERELGQWLRTTGAIVIMGTHGPVTYRWDHGSGWIYRTTRKPVAKAATGAWGHTPPRVYHVADVTTGGAEC